MKKKIISILLTLSVMPVFSPMPSRAYAITTFAESACVMDALTGEVVYDQNCEMRHGMASTTKIMTAVVALENSNWNDVVTVSQNAAAQEGSSAYIHAGDQINMIDLLYGLMLNSGNDAAMAIAEHIAGSADAFADMMNQKAWSIGANNTQFVTPSGLNSEGHFSTAKDMATIMRYALWKEEFRNIIAAKEYAGRVINTGEILIFSNHNKLLQTYSGIIGGKTGYTDATGRCLVSAAERDNMTFIAVTLNDNDDWNDHTSMLDYAFNEYYPKLIIKKGDVIKESVIDGQKCKFAAERDLYAPMKVDGSRNIVMTNYMINDLKSPINAGEKIGFIDVVIDGMPACTVNIVSCQDIKGVSPIRLRNSFFGGFKKMLRELLV